MAGRGRELRNIAKQAQAMAIRLAGGAKPGRGMGLHHREGDEAVYKDVDGTETRTPIPKLPSGKSMVFFEQYPVTFLKVGDIDEHGPHGTVSCMPNGSVYLQVDRTTCRICALP